MATDDNPIDVVVLEDIWQRLGQSAAWSSGPGAVLVPGEAPSHFGWAAQVPVATSAACKHANAFQYANLVHFQTYSPPNESSGVIWDIEDAYDYKYSQPIYQEQVVNLAQDMRTYGFELPGVPGLQKGDFTPGTSDPVQVEAQVVPTATPALPTDGTLPVLGDIYQVYASINDAGQATDHGITYWFTGGGIIVDVDILNPTMGDNPVGESGHSADIVAAIEDALGGIWATGAGGQNSDKVAFRVRPVDAAAFDGLLADKPKGSDNARKLLYGVRLVDLEVPKGAPPQQQWVVSDLDAGWALTGCGPGASATCTNRIMDDQFSNLNNLLDTNTVGGRINAAYNSILGTSGANIVQHGTQVNYILDNCEPKDQDPGQPSDSVLDACSDDSIGYLNDDVWVYWRGGSVGSGPMIDELDTYWTDKKSIKDLRDMIASGAKPKPKK